MDSSAEPPEDDLRSIVSWEPTSVLDRFAVNLHQSARDGFRWILIVTAVGILLGLLIVTGLGAVTDPLVFGMVILSVVPALGLALFIKMADVGVQEPLSLLTVTFMLGVLFAGFAGILNAIGLLMVGAIPIISALLFYYIIVGPVEEGLKLLAVRLYAYRDQRFDAVIDGAIYGAVAGLGFATIENALYITSSVDLAGTVAIIEELGDTTAVRALAGPGHVIYSAIAGYYLGMAKFNPGYAGPLIIKGLTIAALIHGTYNVLAQIVPGMVMELTGFGFLGAFVLFIIVYDGLAGYYLYRKLSTYRRVYRSVRQRGDSIDSPALVEFDDRRD